MFLVHRLINWNWGEPCLMRKFLLAATAMIGVTGVAPLANAQVAPPTVVVVPPPNPATITPSAVDQPGTRRGAPQRPFGC